MTTDRGILIPLAGMYENTSARTGRRYFVGYLGKAKLVMLEANDTKEGEPQWTLYVSERPEKHVAKGASDDRRTV